MSTLVRTLKCGSTTISVINIGDIYLPLAGYMNIPKAELDSTDDLRTLAQQTLIPIHSIYIQLPDTSVLVDAGLYDVETEPEYAIPNYQPPPGLVDRLIELGIQPETIQHVIITHRHWDHFNGTTYNHNGRYVPQFPNAKYYLGRPDWERAETALQDPNSIESRTLKVLHNHGVLELVDGDREVIEGIKIFAAPGETPGHQVVRVQSEGETLYCLGDLYHHPVEFAQPDWKVSWAKSETILPSRHTLTQRALDEQALLVATHIPPIGRLRKTETGVAWEQVLS